MARTAEPVAASIISYEEQTRGWMARIAQKRTPEQQVPLYERLEELLSFYCGTPLLPFDAAAAQIFRSLRTAHPRLGTMDLKIAAIALANEATLLTRNLSDFEKVPGLRAEDWSAE